MDGRKKNRPAGILPIKREANVTQSFTIREATPRDNDALVRLELRSPLVVGNTRESYDRSPDFFACHRLQGQHRVVLAEAGGRPVGVMAGVIQDPVIQGQARRLVYIQRARVDPQFQGQKVAWNLANDIFKWSATLGAEGPYYLIAPGNERSVAFGGRAGRRWPVDLRLLEFDVSSVKEEPPPRIARTQLPEVVTLVNATHSGEDFFEPLSVDSMRERLRRDPRYNLEHLRGTVRGGKLVAVAGFWDKGATTQAIHSDAATGEETRSRTAVVTDWGWAPGHEGAFAGVLRSLASDARALGRDGLAICEPSPGMLQDPGLARREVSVSLYTPAMDPPDATSIRGIYADMLTL